MKLKFKKLIILKNISKIKLLIIVTLIQNGNGETNEEEIITLSHIKGITDKIGRTHRNKSHRQTLQKRKTFTTKPQRQD